ncbi:MAG: tRNA (guanosine(46)-N7)-methyltransferase TrmB [Clostridia bacterium]|nr:tRNA (guanosine(46)-N7)-methyltransferase TrmB [Clostridia bacterium]
MHMRKKKWARPELAACPWVIDPPEHYRGRWPSLFANSAPLHLELGCGKGVATAAMIADNPFVNYLAIDISPDVLGDARRNIAAACGEDVRNALLARANIEQLSGILSPEDGVSRIYIRFCNPWPRRGHKKRRLTHPRQLVQYRRLLPVGGEIWFKTDDDELFRDSKRYFEVSGFEPVWITEDLHASGFSPNYVSEHELRFAAAGIPIKAGIWRKTDAVIDEDFTRWELPGDRPAPVGGTP